MTGYNIAEFYGGGLEALLWGVMDGGKYANQGTAITKGADGAHLQAFAAAESFPFAVTEPDVQDVIGNDKALGQIQFSPIQLPRGPVVLRGSDMNFVNQAMSLKTHAQSGFNFQAVQPGDYTYKQIMYMTVSQSDSLEQDDNSSGYSGILVPWTQSFWRDRENYSARETGQFQISMAAKMSSMYPWTTAFSKAVLGTRTAAGLAYWSKHKPMLYHFIGDGSVYEFNLDPDYPVAENVALNFLCIVDGTAYTWTDGTPTGSQFAIDDADPTAQVLVFPSAAQPADEKDIYLLCGHV
ncbi:MAG TPA: hypothetical protein PKD09_17935 [Aggregatilinea sp.]|uniref:hypothetical protein n=1 Tax=Aggregatilinea sp. TaxID=2806333 RepID=UPI002BB93E62|nr:hypothetical protein [Aggregatilinea sp.]HML23542.1 hypothetical protein [Aggregatilinea sp.]